MKLISNWRKSWRMASVQIAAAAIALGAMPTEVQASILAAVGVPSERVAAIIGLLLIVARLVDQPKTKETPPE